MSWESLNAKVQQAERRAEEFNRDHRLGTPVRYYPIGRVAEYSDTETRSPAWALPSGHAVVQIRGMSGGVSLDHIQVLEEAQTA
mgnify:CR=1 FL=1